ncbi:DUF1365 domain-containing protein [Kangiella aquimarina]|uniref:DUF1365 domain-containing protein n=1 Tax=Kangiella aquimarina TaxID=261965 RepID=A0ABZ0X5K1_9GAMM|nr:DUF1365 domain-containing protein [Kangiella aquimarina]WQG85876.1 DUF1365 domain-containing protein [Kangiella aquimarina]
MLKQGFMVGEIRHRRYRPKPHEFTYEMYWSLLDLDKLEETFAKSKLWSLERWNLISFRNKDFHQNSNLKENNLNENGIKEKNIQKITKTSINKQSIQETIRQHTGKSFSGRVFMLSHLRYLGFNFNSVCFYFCYENDNLKYIVSEITNTPWGERHSYLHRCDEGKKGCKSTDNLYQFEFDKAFHVSPFLTMDMHYQWLFKVEDDQLRIHMVVNQKNTNHKFFDATFTADFIPLTQSNMRKLVLSRPLQPLKMVAAIYWQALKLWLKKIPFVPHPKFNKDSHSGEVEAETGKRNQGRE